MKRTLLLAALLAAALTLSACTPAAETPSPTPLATLAPLTEAPAGQPTAEAPAAGETIPEEPMAEEPAAEAPAAEYHKISAEQAKARMDSGDELIVLDVRTEAEYAEGHIAGAVLLPVDAIGPDTLEMLSDQDAELLVYCRSGNRSRSASMRLVELGYTRVYDFGGVIDWPYGLVKD